jgi:multimeric flavodoxin WrbA
MAQVLVLLGSARQQSDTHRLASLLLKEAEVEYADLLDYCIYPYNYAGEYPADDAFEALMQKVLKHPVLVFATPVYWYAMSGPMKTFFDRLTDLVTIKKVQGRQLKGKHTFLLAVGADVALPEGFEVPFRNTSAYLDMHYHGAFYCAEKDLDGHESGGVKWAVYSNFMTQISDKLE